MFVSFTFHPYGAVTSSKRSVYKHFTPLGLFLTVCSDEEQKSVRDGIPTTKATGNGKQHNNTESKIMIFDSIALINLIFCCFAGIIVLCSQLFFVANRGEHRQAD
jgi:hypothetical protein